MWTVEIGGVGDTDFIPVLCRIFMRRMAGCDAGAVDQDVDIVAIVEDFLC